MTQLETHYRQQARQRFRDELPRHLTGALIAMGVGSLAFAGALWATNPGADAMSFGDADDPTELRTSQR